ncbi:MAG: hypothetical protein J6U20_03955 [Fibrobacter sp.]|nr:hypothetical protein [Fibrobacter sp.]
MTRLNPVHAFDVYVEYTETGNDETAQVYRKYEVDKFIAELKKTHKEEVDRLIVKNAVLEKMVETADKIIKQKDGFTIKDVKFCGVKLEGIKE